MEESPAGASNVETQVFSALVVVPKSHNHTEAREAVAFPLALLRSAIFVQLRSVLQLISSPRYSRALFFCFAKAKDAGSPPSNSALNAV